VEEGGRCLVRLRERDRNLMVPFWMARLPAVSRAFEASFGRFVSTTDAAIVSGASVVSSSSGILSLGDSDMVCEARRSRASNLLSRSGTRNEDTIKTLDH
jgi:hypothetical protein